MFQEVNIQDRPRHFVRGRVLCFTTSKIVEFVNKDQTTSIPLYSQETAYPEKLGLVFTVELDGFLTFDALSYVKILEVGPYQKSWYDPAAFRTNTRPADPFIGNILEWQFNTVVDGVVFFLEIHYQALDGHRYTGYDVRAANRTIEQWTVILQENFRPGALYTYSAGNKLNGQMIWEYDYHW